MMSLDEIIRQITNLPMNSKLELSHTDRATTISRFGPSGRANVEALFVEPDATTPLPDWHCTISRESHCECCNQLQAVAWFKGDGFTAADALDEAVTQLRTRLELDRE